MSVISPFYVAVACGTAGAYVDVTSYVSFAPGDGVAGSWGKQDQFRDANPGTWSLYFNNLDGRFTPDTTNGILATPLTEGMGVNWQLGTRYIAGSIIGFTLMNDGTGRIRVDVDDSLGDLGRTKVSLLSRSMVLGATPYLYWPFNDAAGSAIGAEQSGNQQPPFSSSAAGLAPPTFGYAAIPYIGETQAVINDTANVPFQTSVSPAASGQTLPGRFATINYATGSMGTWGAWFTALASPACTELFIRLNGFNLAGSSSFRFGINSSGAYWVSMGSNNLTSSVPVVVGVPAYLQIVVTNSGSSSITAEFFINGVSQGTCLWAGTGGDPNGLSTNYQRTPQFLSLTFGAAGAVAVSHLSHTPQPVPEYLLAGGTEASILAAAASTTSGVTLGALPSDLSTAASSPQTSSSSALAIINDVIRSEQGYLNCTTTGTLTAPVQAVTVRARQRPVTVSYTFSAVNDLANRAEFTREITNLVASATASGPSTSTTWLDASVTARAASANVSEKVVLTQYIDQLGYAQDRVNRGKNAVLRAPAFVIDAMHTTTDRSADLLALQFGDRVQITDLDPNVTGSGLSTYDCWIIGRTEAQDIGQHKFTFYVQPILASTGIYDTNRYMADGALTLSAGINAAVTSMSVATTGPKLETIQVPYNLLIDSEQVTVTACTSATPQVATITRAVNGTVAASHTTSATIEVAGFAIFYNPILNPSPQLTANGYFTSGAALTGARTAAVGVGGGFGYEATFSAPSTTATDGPAIGSSTDLTVPVVGGATVVPSVAVQAVGVSPTVSWRYAFYDAASTIIGAFANDTVTTAVTGGAAYLRHTGGALLVPATATHMVLRLVWATGTNWPSGSKVRVDQFALNPGPYFDGATASTSTAVNAWNGSPYASGSTQTTTTPAAPSLYAF